MQWAFLEAFGKAFIPDRFRPHMRKYLLKAGVYDIPYTMFGALFVLSTTITLSIYALYIFPYLTQDTPSIFYIIFGTFVSWAIVHLAIAMVFMSCVYFYLDMRIFSRTKQMESVLSEFLQFVSENLKGGMSFDKALWNAVKPQFTVLANEVRMASKKAATGANVEEALMELAEKYESPILRRSFTLIVEGMKGGGRVADVIDRVVENLRDTKKLKQEMSATVLNYVIFIFFVVVVVAPGLFALSKQLLIILSGFAENLAGSLATSTVNIGINFSEVSITPADFTIFSSWCLVVIAIFSSMIISIIQRANIKGGIKYIPLTACLSVGVYFIAQYMLGIMFSAFF